MFLGCRIVLGTVGIVAVINFPVGPGGGVGSTVCVGGVGLGTDQARLVLQANSSRTRLPVPVKIHSCLVVSWGQRQLGSMMEGNGKRFIGVHFLDLESSTSAMTQCATCDAV